MQTPGLFPPGRCRFVPCSAPHTGPDASPGGWLWRSPTSCFSHCRCLSLPLAVPGCAGSLSRHRLGEELPSKLSPLLVALSRRVRIRTPRFLEDRGVPCPGPQGCGTSPGRFVPPKPTSHRLRKDNPFRDSPCKAPGDGLGNAGRSRCVSRGHPRSLVSEQLVYYFLPHSVLVP